MKIDRDGLRIEREDTELINAADSLVTSAVDLARTAGVGYRAGEIGSCEECGDKGPLRPLPANVDGQPTALMLCRSCQREKVNERLSQAVQADDGEA